MHTGFWEDLFTSAELIIILSHFQPSLQVSQAKLQSLVKPSVDFVCQLKFPSGNYPPCLDDNRDLLVHWCHGAPGVIYMLTQAYKVLFLHLKGKKPGKHNKNLYNLTLAFIILTGLYCTLAELIT